MFLNGWVARASGSRWTHSHVLPSMQRTAAQAFDELFDAKP